MNTTLEEDLHFLTEIVGNLTDEEISEIMENAAKLNISARYYLEEFTEYW